MAKECFPLGGALPAASRRMEARGASSLNLHHRITWMEPFACSSMFERLCRRAILDFRHCTAFSTNQKLSGMLVSSLGTSHECAQTFDPMNQSLLHKEIERTINRGRNGAFACFPESVQKLVGSRRSLCLQDQAEDALAQFREMRASAPAGFDRLIEHRFNCAALLGFRHACPRVHGLKR